MGGGGGGAEGMEIKVSEPEWERTANSLIRGPQVVQALGLCLVPSPPTVLPQRL